MLSPAADESYPRLITALGSDRLSVRQKAGKELVRLGPRAEHAIRLALKSKPDLELALRLEALLERLQGSLLPPEALRNTRAVQVLEQIGTPNARKVLERLARGAAEARLTRDVRRALGRLR
jgi:hypothetical protein